jgi:hypothetical protein
MGKAGRLTQIQGTLEGFCFRFCIEKNLRSVFVESVRAFGNSFVLPEFLEIMGFRELGKFLSSLFFVQKKTYFEKWVFF